ncbi:MAG TPA: ABC transporter permease, partial [Actinomycetota bacterium]|nr:ABC transporter permease [Actinomycetota bacterium]
MNLSDGSLVAVLAALAVALAGAALSARLRIRLERSIAVALGRALVQLTIVALVVDAVFANLGLTGLFLLVMLAAAAVTSARRL